MTQTLVDLASPDSFSDLPDAELASDLPPELPPDNTSIVSDAHFCLTCGEQLFRDPGARGRWPKYHPDCRPSKLKTGDGTSSRARTIRVSKAEQVAAEQTEFIIEQFRRGLSKAVALLSLVDPYDALVVQVNAPDILDNMRPVLMRWEWMRTTLSAAGTGGSAVGLIIAVLSTVLPIAAHHNLIPSRKVAQILIGMPMFMLRLQKTMESEDGDMTGELLRRVAEEGKRQTEARMRKENAEATTHARAT